MRGILQCLPQAVDDGIHAVFKLDDSPVGPESLIQFPACDHFAGVFQQHRQDLDGLIGNPNLYTVPPQFSAQSAQRLPHCTTLPDSARQNRCVIFSGPAPRWMLAHSQCPHSTALALVSDTLFDQDANFALGFGVERSLVKYRSFAFLVG